MAGSLNAVLSVCCIGVLTTLSDDDLSRQLGCPELQARFCSGSPPVVAAAPAASRQLVQSVCMPPACISSLCCPSQARKIRQHLMQLGVPPPPASAAPSCSPAAASLAAEPSPSAPPLLTPAVGGQQEPDPHTCFQPDDLQRYQNLRDHSAKLQDLQVELGQGGRESAHACCHSRVHHVLCYPPIILQCASPCCVCVLLCDIVFAACSQGVPG